MNTEVTTSSPKLIHAELYLLLCSMYSCGVRGSRSLMLHYTMYTINVATLRVQEWHKMPTEMHDFLGEDELLLST